MRRSYYPSLSAMAAHAIKAKRDARSAAWDEAGASRRDFGWTFGVTLEQAAAMAATGWPDGAAKAKRLLDSITLPPIENTTTATVYDVAGSYVDVGEYVQGVPECMVDFKEDTRKARFVSILVSGCYAGGISAENVMARGVAIAAVVDALEARGVRCSVTLVSRVSDDFTIDVNLKEHTQPLNLDVLTFALAHPATFRRLIFAELEQESSDYRQRHGVHTGGGYGRVTSIPEEPGTLVFNSTRLGEQWTARTAEKHIQDALKRFTSGA